MRQRRAIYTRARYALRYGACCRFTRAVRLRCRFSLSLSALIYIRRLFRLLFSLLPLIYARHGRCHTIPSLRREFFAAMIFIRHATRRLRRAMPPRYIAFFAIDTPCYVSIISLDETILPYNNNRYHTLVAGLCHNK